MLYVFNWAQIWSYLMLGLWADRRHPVSPPLTECRGFAMVSLAATVLITKTQICIKRKAANKDSRWQIVTVTTFSPIWPALTLKGMSSWLWNKRTVNHFDTNISLTPDCQDSFCLLTSAFNLQLTKAFSFISRFLRTASPVMTRVFVYWAFHVHFK